MRLPVPRSIAWKLPLLVGGVVAVVTLAVSTAAVLEARRSALLAATGRLTSVTQQLVQTLEAGTRQLRVQADSMAAAAAIQDYLRTPNRATRQAASAALAYRGTSPQLVAAVELVNGVGQRLVAVGSDTGRVGSLPNRRAALGARSDSTAIGPLVTLGDSAAYAVVAPVPGARGRAVVVWRYLVSTAASRAQTAVLVGSGATLYLGNAAGGTWTDLGRLVSPPPVDPENAAAPVQYRRGDARQLAMAAPIPGAPWMLLLEFSQEAITGPLRAYIARLGAIAVGLLALGVWAGWLASRRITDPLRELTTAAEAMSAAHYTRRVHADRDDEFGRLADVFNRAAERVRESQLLLEEKVAARTRALERAQDELVRREKLAILGLLASGLSHELRNPLGVMTNAVYYLDGVLVDPPGQVKRYLRILREQIARAEKIVGDLVDFVGVEPPQRQPVAIHALVEGPLARVTVPAHVRVERDIPAQVPPAYVDPSQMGQVMENLLINAVQAIGDEPGVVSVRVAVHDRSHLRVEIGDTGPGIPPDRLDRIFDPLFTTKATGIGLGLPISRTLAAANHATISVTSEEGRGSTFTVVVPTHQEAVAA
jgi:signal transduction histidine kinase